MKKGCQGRIQKFSSRWRNSIGDKHNEFGGWNRQNQVKYIYYIKDFPDFMGEIFRVSLKSIPGSVKPSRLIHLDITWNLTPKLGSRDGFRGVWEGDHLHRTRRNSCDTLRSILLNYYITSSEFLVLLFHDTSSPEQFF